MTQKLIAQGAEAKIFLSSQKILKIRVSKGYRHPLLDESLRKQRTKKESKLLFKALSIIPVPKVLETKENSKEIIMENISGKKLSLHLDKLKNANQVCNIIGSQIALLHNAGIIHGDLTTSNMILKNKKVYFIDFGLGYESDNVEDKAVDLHLIKEALKAKHISKFQELFESVIKGYSSSSNNSKSILTRFDKVEKRGRYKQAY